MTFRGLIIAVLALTSLSFSAHAQDIEAGKKKAEACAACHGVTGNAPVSMFPTLAGQNARYL